jgi:hypothetical protein
MSAKIGGDLDAIGGWFMNPLLVGSVDISKSLVGGGITVKGNVSLHDGCTAIGEAYLTGAQIEGDIDCSGGRLRALNA